MPRDPTNKETLHSMRLDLLEQETIMVNFSMGKGKKELIDLRFKIQQGHTRVSSLQKVARTHKTAITNQVQYFKVSIKAIKTL